MSDAHQIDHSEFHLKFASRRDAVESQLAIGPMVKNCLMNVVSDSFDLADSHLPNRRFDRITIDLGQISHIRDVRILEERLKRRLDEVLRADSGTIDRESLNQSPDTTTRDRQLNNLEQFLRHGILPRHDRDADDGCTHDPGPLGEPADLRELDGLFLELVELPATVLRAFLQRQQSMQYVAARLARYCPETLQHRLLTKLLDAEAGLVIEFLQLVEGRCPSPRNGDASSDETRNRIREALFRHITSNSASGAYTWRSVIEAILADAEMNATELCTELPQVHNGTPHIPSKALSNALSDVADHKQQRQISAVNAVANDYSHFEKLWRTVSQESLNQNSTQSVQVSIVSLERSSPWLLQRLFTRLRDIDVSDRQLDTRLSDGDAKQLLRVFLRLRSTALSQMAADVSAFEDAIAQHAAYSVSPGLFFCEILQHLLHGRLLQVIAELTYRRQPDGSASADSLDQRTHAPFGQSSGSLRPILLAGQAWEELDPDSATDCNADRPVQPISHRGKLFDRASAVRREQPVGTRTNSSDASLDNVGRFGEFTTVDWERTLPNAASDSIEYSVALRACIAKGRVDPDYHKAIWDLIEKAAIHCPQLVRQILGELKQADPATFDSVVASAPESALARVFVFCLPDVGRDALAYSELLLNCVTEKSTSFSDEEARAYKWQFLLSRAIGSKSGASAGALVSELFDNLIADENRTDAARIRAHVSRHLLSSCASRISSAALDELLSAVAGNTPKLDRTQSQTTVHDDLGTAIRIGNAGLVIASAYLPALFDKLQLLDGGVFHGMEAADRAVHLSQYVIASNHSTPEFCLALNKLLCGLDSSALVSNAIEPTDMELTVIHELLDSIIQNWSALGNSSIETLQESFLQRPGRLSYSNDAWRLRVEQKPFDMLLDRLPWSFSTIRSAWMDAPIHVEWR